MKIIKKLLTVVVAIAVTALGMFIVSLSGGIVIDIFDLAFSSMTTLLVRTAVGMFGGTLILLSLQAAVYFVTGVSLYNELYRYIVHGKKAGD